MRAAIALAFAFTSLYALGSSEGDPKKFLIQLKGAASQCALTSSGEATSAFLIGRKNGTSSKKYKAALDYAYKQAETCVAEGKPMMKPLLKAEIEAHPSMRDATLEAYAKWIGYMDWLAIPRDWGEESQEKAAYEQAINRLQAEIDIQ